MEPPNSRQAAIATDKRTQSWAEMQFFEGCWSSELATHTHTPSRNCEQSRNVASLSGPRAHASKILGQSERHPLYLLTDSVMRFNSMSGGNAGRTPRAATTNKTEKPQITKPKTGWPSNFVFVFRVFLPTPQPTTERGRPGSAARGRPPPAPWPRRCDRGARRWPGRAGGPAGHLRVSRVFGGGYYQWLLRDGPRPAAMRGCGGSWRAACRTGRTCTAAPARAARVCPLSL